MFRSSTQRTNTDQGARDVSKTTFPPPVKVWTRAQMVRLYRGESWDDVEAMK
jgi:hypothetical protein